MTVGLATSSLPRVSSTTGIGWGSIPITPSRQRTSSGTPGLERRLPANRAGDDEAAGRIDGGGHGCHITIYVVDCGPCRTGARGWQQLASFLAVFFVVWSLRATVFHAVDASITSPVSRAAYSSLVKLVLWVLPAAAFARVLRKTPPRVTSGFSVWPARKTGWCASP